MSAPLQPSGKPVLLTKANGVTIATPRALWIGTAGTLNFVDETGTTRTNFPAQAGLNPIRITELRESGTADNIWGLY